MEVAESERRRRRGSHHGWWRPSRRIVSHFSFLILKKNSKIEIAHEVNLKYIVVRFDSFADCFLYELSKKNNKYIRRNIMKDLDFGKLYQKILEGLLLIDDFSIDYFSLNKNIREITADFIQNAEYKNPRKEKSELLRALQKHHFFYVTEEEVLCLADYSNTEYYGYLFSDYYSLFSELSLVDKRILATVDLCCGSKLRLIFESKKIPFAFEDFYHLMEYVLVVTDEDFKHTMAKAGKLNLVDFNESKKKLATTKTFCQELLRLSTIPPLYNLDINDFIVSGYDCRKSFSEVKFTAFAGEDVSSFVYTKLEKEKLRFWYAETFGEAINLFQYFKEQNLYNSECVWLSYREANSLKNEALLIKKAEETGTSFIISGTKNDLLGRTYSCVELKTSALEKKIEKIFPPELVKSICDYLSRIAAADKKKEFISALFDYQMSNQHNPYFIKETLPDFWNVFKQRLSKDEIIQPVVLRMIDEDDFEKRYGSNPDNYSDNQGMNNRLKEIHKQLSQPVEFLKADNSILCKAEKLLAQHPNILNKDDLLLSLKNAILFAKDGVIRLDPLLFVGSPGCGKSLLCRQLREILNQDKDCFITIGNGGGVQNLLGTTPEWKGASNGKILSAIWEANTKNCLANPLIVLDELDKGNFSPRGSDNMQNILPVLLLLTGDENLKHFQDLFFEVPINKIFYPNIICTANRLEPLLEPHVESLYNRLRVIHFRDYTEDEMKKLIIPLKYEAFKKEHNELVPEKLSPREIDIIYALSNGLTRQINMGIKKYLGTAFDLEGKRHRLSSKNIEKLIMGSKVVSQERQIGFCR